MQLNAPKKITWWIAVILGVLGIIGALVAVPFLSDYKIWPVIIGWLLLVLGVFLPGF